MASIIYHILKFILLLFLPFILMVRGSIFFMQELGHAPYTSLLMAAGITVVLLFLYFSLFYGRLAGRLGSFDTVKRRFFVALVFVLVYAGHAIFYFSSKNAKTSEVKSEFLELHPILRLGVSTLIYIDSDLILTDAQRKSGDYDRMGLKENSRSKHYRQKDGYVHALDLRTNNRSELRNQMVKIYFKLMGFKTLRHIGTADHLHISI